METLGFSWEGLLGPTGVVVVLIGVFIYYFKFYKPQEDVRNEKRESDLIQVLKEHDAIAAAREERLRADNLVAMEKLVDGCKGQIIEIVKSHEIQTQMITQAFDRLNELLLTIKDGMAANTAVGERMAANYLRHLESQHGGRLEAIAKGATQ